MFLQMCVFFFVFVLLLLVVTMDLMKKKQIRDEPSSLRSEFGKNLIYRPFLSFSLSISRHQPVCECITHLRQIKFEPTDQTTNAHQIASHTALINYVIHSIKIYIIYNKVLISCRHFQCVEFFSSNHTLFRCLSKSNLATALFNRFQHQSKISSYYLLYEAVNEKKSNRKSAENWIEQQNINTHRNWKIMNWPFFRNNHRYAWNFQITLIFGHPTNQPKC